MFVFIYRRTKIHAKIIKTQIAHNSTIWTGMEDEKWDQGELQRMLHFRVESYFLPLKS